MSVKGQAMTTTTTNHVIEMEVSPADAPDSDAYAWFCSCGERGEWEYTDDQDGLAAYAAARADAREHQANGVTDDTMMPCGCESGSCYCDTIDRDWDAYETARLSVLDRDRP